MARGTLVAPLAVVLGVKVTRSLALVIFIPGLILCAPIGFHNLESEPDGGAARGRVPSPPAPPEAFAPSLPTPPEPEPRGPLDLYGNEVMSALAKYRLDPTGSLYELHSPQIEMPRLQSPKS